MAAPKRTTKAQSDEGIVRFLAALDAHTKLLAFFFGLCFVAALLVLAIWFPQPTPFQYTVFRIVLALAAAGIAGIIPGMIRLTVQPGTALLIHAGGALAVFVMVYLLAPARLQQEEHAPPSSPQPKEKPAESKTVPIASGNGEQAAAEVPSKQVGQYIDNNDGTVTDTKTGLMWKRCSEGLSGVNCEVGELKKYQWNDAVQRFRKVEYAGYADWRLPSIDELKTLVYCSTGWNREDSICNDGAEIPTINQQVFPNIGALAYWSGSPNASNSFSAWSVFFDFGHSYAYTRVNSYAVRLVRGGQ